MSKKYEFVAGDEKVVNGVTLKRIRSLVFIPATMFIQEVNIGDIGGYIEHESNLDNSVTSRAWVYSDACVSGNACVYGNAGVYGNACVYGDACVYNDNMLFWASKVGTENGTLTVFNTKSNNLLVTRGCFIGTPEEFLEASRKKHDPVTFREYQLLIEVATSRITKARKQI